MSEVRRRMMMASRKVPHPVDYEILPGFKLLNSGSIQADPLYFTIRYFEINNGDTVQWGYKDGKHQQGLLCEYDKDKNFIDFWTPRTGDRSIKTTDRSKYVAASFTIEYSKVCYIKNLTTGKYLVEGDYIDVDPPEPIPPGKYIQFKDPNAGMVCISKFSSDGIGVTEKDASVVDAFEHDTFNGKGIESFDEIRYFTRLKTIGQSCFARNNIISITIPESVNTLLTGGQSWYRIGTFSENRNLTNITFLGNIKSLPYGCFYKCMSLTFEGITGLDNLVEIGSRCFYNTAISRFVLPSTVTTLDMAAFDQTSGQTFANCANLTEFVSNPVNPPIANDNTFENSPIQGIYVPDESVDLYKTSNGWKTYADKIKPLSQYTAL